MMLLSTLVTTFEDALREEFGGRMLPGHERALRAMAVCRTEASPVLVVQCPDCGERETVPHSCGHRLCPHCQHHEGQRWLDRQRAKLLPVDYYMVTFTLPKQWRSVVWAHQRIAYNLLLTLAWQTLRSFGLNDAKLQGQMGAHAVLHTHSRRLDFHPHVPHHTGRRIGCETPVMAQEEGEVPLSSRQPCQGVSRQVVRGDAVRGMENRRDFA